MLWFKVPVCPVDPQLQDDWDPDSDVRASRGAAEPPRGAALLPAGRGVSQYIYSIYIWCPRGYIKVSGTSSCLLGVARGWVETICPKRDTSGLEWTSARPCWVCSTLHTVVFKSYLTWIKFVHANISEPVGYVGAILHICIAKKGGSRYSKCQQRIYFYCYWTISAQNGLY